MFIKTTHNEKIAQWMNDADMRQLIPDMVQIEEKNAAAREIMTQKDSGRPGHYYGRSAVIEGEMPVAMFHAAALEYGGDPDWWKDDKKFQDYMKRHPSFSWLNG